MSEETNHAPVSVCIVAAELMDLPDNIEDGIREDGTIGDTVFETHYCEIDHLIMGDGYLRVIADNDFTDVETRIPFEMLEAAGWQRVG
ncbi:MAG TPA: hypothetical protein VK421_06305 [Pyrinomonadaceae bacterium]|nr:hypothetical protein [Pyrinomonadaceae bacterium]